MKCTYAVVWAGLLLLGPIARSDQPANPKGKPADKSEAAPYKGRLVLIGAIEAKTPDVHTIQTMAPDGTGRTVHYTVPEKAGVMSGRVAPTGDRVAFSVYRSGKIQELWLLDGKGEARKLRDVGGWVTAWSPDGNRIAYYRYLPPNKDGDEPVESYVYDVTTAKETKLDLPPDYFAEDWHPMTAARLLTYRNSRNCIHREKDGATYPVRQFDLLTAAGKLVPVSKEPAHDYLWPRYSPDGKRLVVYVRRFVDGRPKEYFAVSNTDGSKLREVFSFMDTADAEKYYSFRANNPFWSADGTQVMTLVDTYREAPSAKTPRFTREFLLFISADEGKSRRLALQELGLKWIQALDWR